MIKNYECNDSEGILPADLHKAAIQFAKEKTGIERPVKEQAIIIDSFRECFKYLNDQGLLKDVYEYPAKNK